MTTHPSQLPPLRVLDALVAICRLAADEAIPDWAHTGSFVSITRTDRELSIVTDAGAVPERIRCEATFRALGFAGTLDFALTGVLAGLCEVLARAEISVFAISTFDTDYVLVRERDLEAARRVLAEAGYGSHG